jgi:hypothetical protein
MPTANNQNLDRGGKKGQAKKNYSAVRYGTDKGSISFGHLDKKATVTSGVKLDTPDGRHQFNLEIDGERKGWTSSTSPGNFQVECGSDNEEADTTCVINALNGDICITATNGKIRLQGTDIELVAIGEGGDKGHITCSATETFTVHETKKIILDSKSLTRITSTGIISIAANSCLKLYGSVIRGVTDACSKKDSKTGGQRMQKESNQV